VTAFGRCRSAATSSGVWPGILEPVAELAGEGGLAGTLQAGEHDDRRRVLREIERALSVPPPPPAEDADELLVDDLDDLLRGVEGLD
jgi:hypothetical protein